MTTSGIVKMIRKFKATVLLGIHNGREGKFISTDLIGDVAYMVEENRASNSMASRNDRHSPRCRSFIFFGKFCHITPVKYQIFSNCCKLITLRLLFSLELLACCQVAVDWPWHILWTKEIHFHLDVAVNRTVPVSEVIKILIWFFKFRCILRHLDYGAYLLQFLSWVRFFFSIILWELALRGLYVTGIKWLCI